MSDDPRPSYDDVVAENAALRSMVEVLRVEVAELKRRLGSDSSNSSKPPSSDPPWAKPARPRSSRSRSGRKPGKQPGTPGTSRRLTDDPDRIVALEPDRCAGCASGLDHAAVADVERRQILDLPEPVPAEVIEYRRYSKTCGCCGVVTAAGWDDPAVPTEHVPTLTGPGSPVRIGPDIAARAALLTCAHYLPVGRAREVLAALSTIEVSTGFLAGIRGRAARRLERVLWKDPATGVMRHADAGYEIALDCARDKGLDLPGILG